jgi:outer membrane lipoprotein SlyB
MRRFLLSLAATSLAVTTSMALPTSEAQARKARHYKGSSHRYYRTCRHSSGTTGLIAGGVGGALVGNSILGHGALGTIGGAAAGALGGRAIDRTITAKKRGCK